MKKTITVGSVTYAQKAKRALVAEGIRARIVKVDDPLEIGCIYGIEIREEAFATALSILRAAGIPCRGAL